MSIGVEVKRVDSRGRVTLPLGWRRNTLPEDRKVIVVNRGGFLKIMPKRRVDLTVYFDAIDLGVEAIEEWSEFKRGSTSHP